MSKTAKLLAGAATLAVFSAGTAQAAGTEAGTTVSNTFTLNYNVGSTPQTTITPAAPTDFAVDRIVDVAVASGGNVTGAPGEAGVTQTFTVTNEGNGWQAYDLNILQEASASNDDFDGTITNVSLIIKNAAGTTIGNVANYNPAGVVRTPDVPPDGTVEVTVTTSIPAGRDDSDTSDIALIANTYEPASNNLTGTAATQPETVGTPAATTNGQSTVETVLNDSLGTTGVTGADAQDDDTNPDGAASAASTITVEAADVTATKAVGLVSADGSSCGTFPATLVAEGNATYIPGSCVQYTISIENTGTAAATSINLQDVLQEELTYVDAQNNITSGTLSEPSGTSGANSTVCNWDGSGPLPTTGPCRVGVTGGTVGAGDTETLIIHALVK